LQDFLLTLFSLSKQFFGYIGRAGTLSRDDLSAGYSAVVIMIIIIVTYKVAQKMALFVSDVAEVAVVNS